MFRIVVQERNIAPNGRHVEIVGSWDPHHKKGTFRTDRITHWIGHGALASDSVHNLLVAQGVIESKKRSLRIALPKKEVKDEVAVEASTQEKASA